MFFLFRILTNAGLIEELKTALVTITGDQRIQLLLVAFCFGAILEGAAGFGTPVAITASILIGLGFSPLDASVLSLLANTAPVAYGGLGTPIIALQGVTGLDLGELSATVGRLLSPIGAIIPIWLVWAYAGWKKTREILPILLVSGITYSIAQRAISLFHGPWLVGVGAGIVSLAATLLALKFSGLLTKKRKSLARKEGNSAWRLWLPWLVLIVLILVWGLPGVKSLLDQTTKELAIPVLDQQVLRMPPIIARPAAEPAVFKFNCFCTGTAFRLVLSTVCCLFKPRKS